MTNEKINQRLLRAERKTRKSKVGRWMASPVLYPSLMIYNYLLYPFTKKGVYARVHPFFGIPMRTLLPAGTDLLLNGIKSHDSEIRLAKFITIKLKPNDVFIDVGAHYGYYTLLASVLVGDGKVFAIEASSTSFELLKENTEGISNAKIFHAAAGDQDGEIIFYEYPGPYAEYNTTVKDAYVDQPWLKKTGQKTVSVQVMVLDDLINREKIERAFIKIDVEGGESSVLKGLQKSLAEKDLLIAMEYLVSDQQINSHAMAANMLKKAGYQSCQIDANGKLIPVDDIDEYLKEKKLGSDNVVFVKIPQMH
ncbi:MAG: FkbM family methyltransferase [Saprospiraceae bacterium]